jgi:hypothetical protein
MSKPIDIKWSDALPRRHSVYEDYAMQHNNQQNQGFSSFQNAPFPASYYASIPPGSPPRSNIAAFPSIFKNPTTHSPNASETQSGHKPNERMSPDFSTDPITRLKTAFSKHSGDSHHTSMHSPYTTFSPPLSPSLQTSFPASSATLRRHSISSPASLPTKLAPRPSPTEQTTEGAVVSPTSPTSNHEYFFRERHHIRRPSVAINFADAATDADDEVVDLKSGVRERRDSFMKRPPSPMVECILKGDFSFD